MHPGLRFGINVAIALLLILLTVIIAFIIDTSVLGHIEGFNGVFVDGSIGLLVGFLYLIYSIVKFFKDTERNKKVANANYKIHQS